MPPDEGLQARLREILGPDGLAPGGEADAVDGRRPPLAASPATPEAVAALLAACAAAEAAVLPRGGGTRLGLGNPPARAAVALRTERLGAHLQHDAPNLTVTAGAGLRLETLQAALAERGQFLPLDPPAGAGSTVGGLLAANASGPGRLLYGTARDWVLGLRVALPSGELIGCGGRVIKNVSGYDLTRLFLGSLGTLGVITEATFRLLPLPATRAAVVGAFRAPEAAARVVARVLDSALLPEALDLLNPGATARLGGALPLEGRPGHLLVAAFAGSHATVERQARDLMAWLGEAGAAPRIQLAPARAVETWRGLRAALGETPAGGTRRARVRLGVPIGRTVEFLVAAEEGLGSLGGTVAVHAHAGSGLLRVEMPLGSPSPDPAALAAPLADLRAQAEAAEGSLVVEEAPPGLKRLLDAWGSPGDGIEIMRRLKAEYDPRGILNPGRFVGGI